MNKLSLRKESLTELSIDQMRNLAGALPNGGTDTCTIHISVNTCVCLVPIHLKEFNPPPPCNVYVSEGSCVCGTA